MITDCDTLRGLLDYSGYTDTIFRPEILCPGSFFDLFFRSYSKQIEQRECEKLAKMVVSSKKRKNADEKALKANKKAKTKSFDPIERLNKVVNANYFLTVEGDLPSATLKRLKNAINIDTFELKQKTEEGKFLAFNADIDEANKSENFGVIIGPNTETERGKIVEFYELWGKKFCSLRRFQDGNTHETIALNSVGLSYMPLAKFKHLIEVHHPKAAVTFHHFNEDFRRQGLKLHHELLQHRKQVEAFCQKIRDLCDTEDLPLRKIQAHDVSMYKGNIESYQLCKIHSEPMTENKVVCCQDGVSYIQENGKIPPSKLTSVKIVLEVSEKSQMSVEMFARLKFAYAIKLREKLPMKSVLKSDGEILVIEKDMVYNLCVRPPYQISNYVYQMQEKLALTALHHLQFPALCKLTQKWLASQFLSKTIDETLIGHLPSTFFVHKSLPNFIDFW